MNSVFNSYCFKSLSMYWDYTRHWFIQYMNDITYIVIWGCEEYRKIHITWHSLHSYFYSLDKNWLNTCSVPGIILDNWRSLLQKVTNIANKILPLCDLRVYSRLLQNFFSHCFYFWALIFQFFPPLSFG